MANGDYVNMDYADFELINKYTGNKFSKYFIYPGRGLGIEEDYPVRIMPELKKQIKFSVADITEDIHNLPARNTLPETPFYFVEISGRILKINRKSTGLQQI